MAVWPATLQQALNSGDFSLSVQDPTIRSEIDVGPVKQRPRYTATPEIISGSITVNRDEFNTFYSFWKNDLMFGSISFDWIHPITGEVCSARFRNKWTLTPINELYFKVNMELEILP